MSETLICMFDERNPVEITLGRVWSCRWLGKALKINWDKFDLPPVIVEEARDWALTQVTERSPVLLSQLGVALNKLAANKKNCWLSFADISRSDWNKLWKVCSAGDIALLTQIYSHVVMTYEDAELDSTVTYLKRKRRPKHRTINDPVLDWHPTKGPLTHAEFNLVREHLRNAPEDESDAMLGGRVLLLITLETIKRSSQVLGIRKDDFYSVTAGDVTQWFVKIPKVKGQTGEEPGVYKLTEDTAKIINRFCARPSIATAQADRGSLIAWETDVAPGDNRMPYDVVMKEIPKLFKGLESPRTGEQIHVTCLRLRHTGATEMARNGRSLEEIKAALEHDSPDAAMNYIHAVGTDILPVLERLDANSNYLFTRLGAAYTGERYDGEVTTSPVYIPDPGKPLVSVGRCAKPFINVTSCDRHPFHGCYDCSFFRPDPDSAVHAQASAFIEEQQRQYEIAEGVPDRGRFHQQFGDLAARIAMYLEKS